ncbi:hypothetical protein QKY98_09240 [Pseudomonas sp. HR1]|uniref:hypothetical protein n=1 Tax=Pseudomonas TaxID=286 RepID=UPI0005AA8A0E|nr:MULTISPECIES: hypothetical protein [Pseudomonas]KIZ49355.1 hypothetical protein UM91_17605 [Pseudomonas oryzihabitans]MBA1257291.1 hypothetical protein [Pseudomonas psychrotolerans]MBH3331951.1 hypothetical protein [Pseudomonas oryzihabitans]MDK4199300.1 hypothetical protein [Pseudomonas sp. HR1]NMZ43825.1 hypothetical protein [Pseudomonas oryzihabitans]
MKNAKLATLPTQTLMQRLTRELDGWTVLVSPTCPDGSIFARLYSRADRRAIVIPFDVQAIDNDSYIRERLALVRASRV